MFDNTNKTGDTTRRVVKNILGFEHLAFWILASKWIISSFFITNQLQLFFRKEQLFDDFLQNL